MIGVVIFFFFLMFDLLRSSLNNAGGELIAKWKDAPSDTRRNKRHPSVPCTSRGSADRAPSVDSGKVCFHSCPVCPKNLVMSIQSHDPRSEYGLHNISMRTKISIFFPRFPGDHGGENLR